MTKSNWILQVFALSLIVLMPACSDPEIEPPPPPPPPPPSVERVVENFTITSNGTSWEAKIFIPDAYETNNDLPVIYLLDLEEVDGLEVAYDEFDRVIDGIEAIEGSDALVVTLADFFPEQDFNTSYPIYNELLKDLISYVGTNYTNNPSRTLIGRGRAGSMVLNILFKQGSETAVFQNFIATGSPAIVYLKSELNFGRFPQDLDNLKLHYSFTSSSNFDIQTDFINVLKEKWPSLAIQSAHYPHFNFYNAYTTIYADGLKFIFED